MEAPAGNRGSTSDVITYSAEIALLLPAALPESAELQQQLLPSVAAATAVAEGTTSERESAVRSDSDANSSLMDAQPIAASAAPGPAAYEPDATDSVSPRNDLRGHSPRSKPWGRRGLIPDRGDVDSAVSERLFLAGQPSRVHSGRAAEELGENLHYATDDEGGAVVSACVAHDEPDSTALQVSVAAPRVETAAPGPIDTEPHVETAAPGPVHTEPHVGAAAISRVAEEQDGAALVGCAPLVATFPVCGSAPALCSALDELLPPPVGVLSVDALGSTVAVQEDGGGAQDAPAVECVESAQDAPAVECVESAQDALSVESARRALDDERALARARIEAARAEAGQRRDAVVAASADLVDAADADVASARAAARAYLESIGSVPVLPLTQHAAAATVRARAAAKAASLRRVQDAYFQVAVERIRVAEATAQKVRTRAAAVVAAAELRYQEDVAEEGGPHKAAAAARRATPQTPVGCDSGPPSEESAGAPASLMPEAGLDSVGGTRGAEVLEPFAPDLTASHAYSQSSHGDLDESTSTTTDAELLDAAAARAERIRVGEDEANASYTALGRLAREVADARDLVGVRLPLLYEVSRIVDEAVPSLDRLSLTAFAADVADACCRWEASRAEMAVAEPQEDVSSAVHLLLTAAEEAGVCSQASHSSVAFLVVLLDILSRNLHVVLDDDTLCAVASAIRQAVAALFPSQGSLNVCPIDASPSAAITSAFELLRETRAAGMRGEATVSQLASLVRSRAPVGAWVSTRPDCPPLRSALHLTVMGGLAASGLDEALVAFFEDVGRVSSAPIGPYCGVEGIQPEDVVRIITTAYASMDAASRPPMLLATCIVRFAPQFARLAGWSLGRVGTPLEVLTALLPSAYSLAPSAVDCESAMDETVRSAIELCAASPSSASALPHALRAAAEAGVDGMGALALELTRRLTLAFLSVGGRPSVGLPGACAFAASLRPALLREAESALFDRIGDISSLLSVDEVLRLSLAALGRFGRELAVQVLRHSVRACKFSADASGRLCSALFWGSGVADVPTYARPLVELLAELALPATQRTLGDTLWPTVVAVITLPLQLHAAPYCAAALAPWWSGDIAKNTFGAAFGSLLRSISEVAVSGRPDHAPLCDTCKLLGSALSSAETAFLKRESESSRRVDFPLVYQAATFSLGEEVLRTASELQRIPDTAGQSDAYLASGLAVINDTNVSNAANHVCLSLAGIMASHASRVIANSAVPSRALVDLASAISRLRSISTPAHLASEGGNLLEVEQARAARSLAETADCLHTERMSLQRVGAFAEAPAWEEFIKILRAWSVPWEHLRMPNLAALGCLVSEHEEFRRVADFLSNRGLFRGAPSIADTHAATASPQSLREELGRLRASLKSLLTPAALVALRGFSAGQNSSLFLSRFDAAYGQVSHRSDANSIVLAAASELEVLVSAHPTRLSAVFRVHASLRSCRDRMPGELASIGVYLAARACTVSANGDLVDDGGSLASRFRDAGLDAAILRGVDRVEAAMEMLDLKEHLARFLWTLKALHLVPQIDSDGLEIALKALTEDPLLEDTPTALASALQLIGGISPSHVALVSELDGGLVELLQSFESAHGSFEDRENFVVSQAQGRGRIEVDLINTFVGALPWLKPFCVGARPAFESCFALAACIQSIATSPSDAAERAKVVRNLSANVAILKTLLAAGDEESARALVCFVRDVMPQARFVSCLVGSASGAALQLEYVAGVDELATATKQRMSQTALAEKVRHANRALLLLPTVGAVSIAARDDLENFSRVFAGAMSVHQERLRLERLGHPEFYVPATSAPRMPSFASAPPVEAPGCAVFGVAASQQALKAEADELRAAAESWQNLLHQTRLRSRRVLMLDDLQLVRFVQACALPAIEGVGLRTRNEKVVPAMAVALLPYVLLCFPEALNVRHAVEKALITALQHPGGVLPAPASHADRWSGGSTLPIEPGRVTQRSAVPAAQLLERAESILQRIVEAIPSHVALQDEADANRALALLSADTSIDAEVQSAIADCSSLSEDEIYRLVLSTLSGSGGAMPSPVQIMNVGKTTSSCQVESFVRRAGAFPKLQFAIVGVDSLTVPVRETLAHALSTPLGRQAKVLLVFQQPSGLSSIAPLVQKCLDTRDRTGIPSSTNVRAYAASTLRDVSVASSASSSLSDVGMFTGVTLVVGESGSGKTFWIKQQLRAQSTTIFTVSIHDSFDVMAFITEYRARVEDATKMRPAGRPVIGVHFNIFASAVARSGSCQVATAMHDLFTQGFLIDSTSGIVAMLDKSVCHAVFIELPALPSWPLVEHLGGPMTVAHHPWLLRGRLAVLNVARSKQFAVHRESVPFVFDPPACTAAEVLKALLAPSRKISSDRADHHTTFSEFLARTPPLGANPGAAYEALWASPTCAGLHPTNLSRRAFVLLWVKRAGLLTDLRGLHAKAVRDCTDRDNSVVEAFREVPFFYERVGFSLLAECIQLCDRNLRRNWADSGHQGLWSIRGSDASRLDRFKLLCLTAGVHRSHAALKSELLSDVTDATARSELHSRLMVPPAWEEFAASAASQRVVLLGKRVILRDDVCAHTGAVSPSPSSLSALLAPAFGQSDAARFERILVDLHYVLSADFAVKLLVLNERRNVGASVIVSGDTGVGKSELFRMCSAVINADADIIPDVPTCAIQALLKIVKQHAALSRVPLPLHSTETPAGRGPAAGAASTQGRSLSEGEVLPALQSLLDYASGDVAELRDVIGDSLARFFFALFVRYPVMQVTRNMHARFSTVHANLLVEKALSGGKNADQALADASLRDRNKRTARVVLGGEMSPREEEDLLAALRSLWARTDLTGLSTDDASLGDWKIPLPPLSSVAAAALMQRRRAVFQRPQEIIEFVQECLNSRPRNMYFTWTMNEKVTENHWRGYVREAVEAAKSLVEVCGSRGPSRRSHVPYVVAFVDELNTASPAVLSMIKEVFIDGTLDGAPLLVTDGELRAPNIFWAGAINPAMMGHHDGRTVVARPPPSSLQADFVVRELPLSLQQLVLDYDSLSPEQERDFLFALFSSAGNRNLVHQRDARVFEMRLVRVVLACQAHVRACDLWRVHVSIRDIMRALKLYGVLLQPVQRKIFLPAAFNGDELATQWCALIVAVTLAYKQRLPASARPGLSAALRRILDDEGCPADLDCDVVVLDSMRQVFDGTAVPAGVAPTGSLVESIYTAALCLEAGIALNVTGPPGCGKTLAVQIIVENMRGPASAKPLYRMLRNLRPVSYQCSEGSTAEEIASVFEGAISRHELNQRNRYSDVMLVILDEAGLPPERHEALKAIHEYLDHPKVACIMLANSNLDAAKLNRCLQITQSAATEADLYALAEGCIVSPDHLALLRRHCAASAIPTQQHPRLLGLCKAFESVQGDPLCWAPHLRRASSEGTGGLFHQRDFVFLCRYLRREIVRSAATDMRAFDPVEPFSAAALIAGLRRNFGGVSDAAFERLVGRFLDCCGFTAATMPALNSIATLRESLADSLAAGDDPNTASFRHVLLMDPTDVEASVGMVFDMGLLAPAAAKARVVPVPEGVDNMPARVEVIALSDFCDDGSELARWAAVARIAEAAEEGRTVILVNAAPIASAIFDLLNRRYTRLVVASGDERHYANVAFGSYSRPCIVHPDFRLIVHLPASAVARSPLPFLNRFEKYTLSKCDALDERLSQLAALPGGAAGRPCNDADLWRAIRSGVEEFAESLAGPVSLAGYVPGETVAALVLRALEDSTAHPTGAIAVRSALHASSPLTALSHRGTGRDADVDGGTAEHGEEPGAPVTRELERSVFLHPREQLSAITRLLCFQLLQLARPECIPVAGLESHASYAKTSSQPRGLKQQLDSAFVQEYVTKQEHFSAANLMRSMVSKHWAKQLRPAVEASDTVTKFMLFTRTDPGVARLVPGDGAFLSLVRAGVADAAAAAGAGHVWGESEPASAVSVLQLRSIRSSEDVASRVASFMDAPCDGGARVLLVIGDTTEVSASQVTCARQQIDASLVKWSTGVQAGTAQTISATLPLVFVLLHCPPEVVNIGFPYHAVPASGWEYCFCDALGLQDSGSSQVPQAAESTAVAPVEPRRWIAVAYGLAQTLSPAEARAEFGPMFDDALDQAASGLRTLQRGVLAKTLVNAGVVAAKAIYQDTGAGSAQQKATRAKAAMLAVFHGRPYLRDVLLSCFIRTCRVALTRTVRASAAALLHGHAVRGSFLESARSSLRWVLRDYLRATLIAVARDYGLEPLAQLPSDAPTGGAAGGSGAGDAADAHDWPALRAYVSRALRSVAAVIPDDVSEAASAAASAPDTVRITCELGSVAPSLPFFAQVYAPLRDLVAAALERSLAASAACAADDVVRTVHVLLDEGGGATAAARHIGGSDGLVGLLACIEGSPPVFRRFARDVLALKHGFGRAPAPELRVLVELALVLLQQAQGGGAAEGGGGGGLSCVRLLLLQRDPAAGAALAQASSLMEPLRALAAGDSDPIAPACSEARSILGLPAPLLLMDGAVVGSPTLAGFLRVLTAGACIATWAAFLRAAEPAWSKQSVRGARAKAAEEDVRAWVAAARPLIAALGDLASVRSALPPDLAACVVTMAVALRMLAHVSLPPANAPRALAALRASREDLAGDDSPTLALPLRLLARAALSVRTSASVDPTAFDASWLAVVEDTLRWAVPPPPPPGTSRGPGGPASVDGAGLLEPLALGRIAQLPPAPDAGSVAAAAAAAQADLQVLRSALLGLPLDGGTAAGGGGLGEDAAAAAALVSRLPLRVRVDMLAGHAAAVTSGESGAVAAALAPFDDLLSRYVAPPGEGGASAAIAYTPQALADAATLLPLPRAVFAGDAAAPGALSASLCFRSPAATAAAATLYDSLYEAALRARCPALTTAPGLAAALLETAGHRRGAPCVRSARRPAAAVWSAVLAVRLLEILAEAAGADPAEFIAARAAPAVAPALRQAFTLDFPAAAPPFFLLSLRSQAAVETLLGDAAALRALSLPPSLHVARESSAFSPQRALGLLPFQGVVEGHPWGAAYAATIAAVCGPAASVRTVRDWADAAGAGGSGIAYRARALLVLAVYDECWVRGCGRPCAVLLQWLDAPERHAALLLKPEEVCLLRFIAAGPVPGGYLPAHGSAEDLPYLFSAESRAPGRDSPDLEYERSAAILALAAVLGVPRELNYFHLAAFQPELLDSHNTARTLGLGSGHSNYAKDCGYMLEETATGFSLMNAGEVPPYGGCVRSRLISNALIFAAQCWGHVALRGNATATTSLKRNYTYLGEWQGGAALDEFHKITSYAYARARRFLRYLGVEGTVAGQGSESLLLWSLAVDRLLVGAQAPDSAAQLRRHFPMAGGADAHRTCMAALKRLWDSAFRDEPDMRARYVVYMKTNELVKSVCEVRARFVNSQRRAGGALPGRSASDRRSAFEAFLAARATVASPRDSWSAPSARLVSSFVSRMGGLRLSAFIPTLVATAQWFPRTFSFRFTSTEAGSLTAREAVERLPAGELRDTGRAVLARFERVWAILADVFVTYIICPRENPAAAEIPRFEVGNPLRLAALLHTSSGASAADSPDIITRMLRDRLLPAINDLLSSPDMLAVRADDGGDGEDAVAAGCSAINAFGCNAESSAPKIDLGTLPPPDAVARTLLTGTHASVAGAAGASGAYDEADDDLFHFVAAHAVVSPAVADDTPSGGAAHTSIGSGSGDGRARSAWEFDLKAITSFILSRYVAGRAMLSGDALFAATAFKPRAEPAPPQPLDIVAWGDVLNDDVTRGGGDAALRIAPPPRTLGYTPQARLHRTACRLSDALAAYDTERGGPGSGGSLAPARALANRAGLGLKDSRRLTAILPRLLAEATEAAVVSFAAELQRVCEGVLSSLPDEGDDDDADDAAASPITGAPRSSQTIEDALHERDVLKAPASALLVPMLPLSLAALPALAAAVATAIQERVWIFGSSPSLNVPLPVGLAARISADMSAALGQAADTGGSAAVLPLLARLQGVAGALQAPPLREALLRAQAEQPLSSVEVVRAALAAATAAAATAGGRTGGSSATGSAGTLQAEAGGECPPDAPPVVATLAERLLPPSVLVQHYGPFLRLVLRVCGDAQQEAVHRRAGLL